LPTKRSNSNYILIPFIGICLFTILYFTATLFYPGGNETDRSAKGFSWQHNYWCELLATHAENGEINTAKPVAITAMIILAVSLAILWFYIPEFLTFKNFEKHVIRYSGILSMAILFFLFTGSHAHDTVLNISGILGVIAITATLTGLHKTRQYKLFGLGIVCLILCFINNYIYYTKDYLFYLPVIQKISFLLFLLWFSLLNILLYRKIRLAANNIQ
jgi:hypothetical protein